MRRDFLVRRTGASAAALSLKWLQHEITLENLVGLSLAQNSSESAQSTTNNLDIIWYRQNN
jgi:hypothetical protein